MFRRFHGNVTLSGKTAPGVSANGPEVVSSSVDETQLDTKKRLRCLAAGNSKGRRLITLHEQTFGINDANLTGGPTCPKGLRGHTCHEDDVRRRDAGSS